MWYIYIPKGEKKCSHGKCFLKSDFYSTWETSRSKSWYSGLHTRTLLANVWNLPGWLLLHRILHPPPWGNHQQDLHLNSNHLHITIVLVPLADNLDIASYLLHWRQIQYNLQETYYKMLCYQTITNEVLSQL